MKFNISLPLFYFFVFFNSLLAGPLTGKKIFVDPGHGGTDSGAVGPTGLKESVITLKTSLDLRGYLINSGGAQSLLTRETDLYVTLQDRVAQANNWNANRFISVHYNACTDRTVNGTETLYYTYGSANSKDLATKLQNRLVEALGLSNRGIKTRDNLYVLHYTNMPAALTESSFISNTYEEARLKNSDYLNKVAKAHYYGLLDHYGVTDVVPQPEPQPNPPPNSQPNPENPEPVTTKPLDGKTFVIDPQSGGSAKGAKGPTGLYAKEVNLRVAVALKDNLEKEGGSKVTLTRDSDVNVSTLKRIEIANDSDAERLISINFPGSSNPSYNYTKTYYKVLSDTSKDLAIKVQARLVDALKLMDKGVGKSVSLVLIATSMPGIITQPSLITNPYEEARLRDVSYTSKIGRYLYLGITDHYGVKP